MPRYGTAPSVGGASSGRSRSENVPLWQTHVRTASLSTLIAWLGLTACSLPFPRPSAMEHVRVADDGRSFALAQSGRAFVPWGFNYDHDSARRLLEDYWEDEWATVESDFREMKELGANVVRVHLQFGKFMRSPTEPDAASLRRLRELVQLAERTGLYLIVTGLGCYRKPDVPAWYGALDEEQR